MSNKYNLINSSLSTSSFDIKNIKSNSQITIQDEISIKSILDNDIAVTASRSLSCSDMEKHIIDVTYEVRLRSNELYGFETVVEDIKKGLSIFSNVFSRISLTIAQITNSSLLGAIVTPPMYDKKSIIISNDCK